MTENNVRVFFKNLIESTQLRSTDSPQVRQNILQTFSYHVEKIKPEKLYRYRRFDGDIIKDLQSNIVSTINPIFYNDENDSLVQMNEKDVIEHATNPENIICIRRWLHNNPGVYKALSRKQQAILKSIVNDTHASYALTLRYAKIHFEKFLPKLIIQARNYLKQKPHIACLTETPTSYDMWESYANNHKGFVLEYPFSNYVSPCLNCTSKCIKHHLELLFPIVYTDTPFDARSFVLKYFKDNYCSNSILKNSIPIDDELAMYKALLYKLKKFEVEKEWRVISFCELRPAIKLKPTAVFMGKNIAPENKNLLMQYAKSDRVALYQMNENINFPTLIEL